MPVPRRALTRRRHAVGLSQMKLAALLDVDRKSVARWEAGASTPRDWVRPQLADALGVSIEEIDALISRSDRTPAVPSGFHGIGPQQIVAAGPGDPLLITTAPEDPADLTDLHSLVAGAAHTSTAFASLVSASNVSDPDLDRYRITLSRIATDYVHAPLLPLVSELIAVRDRLFALLHGQQNLRQRHDLFLLTGVACLLLAHASQNMGESRAALAQLRTARLCADQTGHPGLRAWTFGTGALIAEWSHSSMALEQTEQAAALAPAGDSRIRIAAIEARAAARLGDRRRALAAIDRVHDTRQNSPVVDEVTDFGGLLTFPPAKEHYYLGSTYTLLGDYDAARQHATAAIDAYRDGPTDERSYGDEALAHVDLITIGVNHDDAAEVEAAIRPVLDLPPQMRIRQLGSAMSRLTSLTRDPTHRTSRAARQLADLVHDYAPTDTRSALPE
ncbi:hypothetical protein GCM10028784_39440 [Myceligenerans cantabricum]